MESGRVWNPVRATVSAEGLAGSIYGTVTACAVIAAVSEYKATIHEIALSAVGTVLALTISHGYANWIALRPDGGSHGELRVVIEHQWPIVVAAIIVAAAMQIPSLLGASYDTSVEIALWFSVLLLFALGFRAAQRSGRDVKTCLLLAMFDSLIGVAIITLKASVH
ncbi:MAG: hypothetical protein ACRDKI_07265 [Solirubrobacterales bacterium]